MSAEWTVVAKASEWRAPEKVKQSKAQVMAAAIVSLEPWLKVESEPITGLVWGAQSAQATGEASASEMEQGLDRSLESNSGEDSEPTTGKA